MQNVSLKSLQEDAADDRHKQTTFSDADFLGALRVKNIVCNKCVYIQLPWHVEMND